MAFERVKQFKEITGQYLSDGDCTLLVTTDFEPSGRSFTLAASTGTTRTPFTCPLDKASSGGILEGNWIKVKWTPGSSTIFRLYGATVKVRPIGVYLVGSKGETWTVQEEGLGVG